MSTLAMHHWAHALYQWFPSPARAWEGIQEQESPKAEITLKTETEAKYGRYINHHILTINKRDKKRDEVKIQIPLPQMGNLFISIPHYTLEFSFQTTMCTCLVFTGPKLAQEQFQGLGIMN